MSATSRAIKKHADELEVELAEVHEWADTMLRKIEVLEEKLEHANRWISELVNDLSGARMQITTKDAALRELQRTLEAACEDARTQIAAKDKKLNHQIDASNQQIKVRDADNNKLRAQIADLQNRYDSLDHNIDHARAQIAASEQEHQDFRLQNDSEWRAKLDHLKAQIAAKDAALREALHCVDDPDVYYIIEKALAAPARETSNE